ncbi:hypothetical protein [uncultured Solobacterium sp.]|uniref:hypothetical protein n=1 Tax=uncultured Solobacterium sp. TaxID=747375 RepID=UPI0028EC3CCE|nr:hypothetical protein [uncultured Solobacterium sp.]
MKTLVILIVLVGILCLIGTIVFVIRFKQFKKSIFEMQATLDCDEFTITEQGSYAIWLRVPRGTFSYPRLNIVVNEVETGREIPIHHETFKVESSSFSYRARQYFWFEAEEGNYLLSIQRNTDMENMPLIDKLFKVDEQPLDGCSVFVAKRVNPTMIGVGILIAVISFNAIVFSIIMISGLF